MLDLVDAPGTSVVGKLGARFPDVAIVLVAAEASVPDAVEAMKAGAADFLVEPLDPEAIAFVVRKARATSARADEAPPPLTRSRTCIIGTSAAMREVEALLGRAAQSAATVLVRGESGTGKEMVARAIHELSPRRDRPFVTLHCAALPDSLLESELFGYEKGAFTGAAARKPGRFELAHGGTLFLDEIGDISPATQVKLLRVLQERELERLGGTETIKVDVRFVAATHRDLEGLVAKGTFREDLFYRLNVVPVWLPPLRARREDIEPLATHFVAELAKAHGKAPVRLTDDAIRALRRERWPGNVRQLQNFVERLVVLSTSDTIDEAAVAGELRVRDEFVTEAPSLRAEALDATTAMAAMSGDLEKARLAAERAALTSALERAAGNRTVAARLLGVSRRTLYNKLAEHGLS